MGGMGRMGGMGGREGQDGQDGWIDTRVLTAGRVSTRRTACSTTHSSRSSVLTICSFVYTRSPFTRFPRSSDSR